MKLFKTKEIERIDSRFVYGGQNGIDTSITIATCKNGISDTSSKGDWYISC